MKYIVLALSLTPAVACADWSSNPLQFTFDATAVRCLATPTAPALTQTCRAYVTEAYVLKRAVARATQACLPDDLATCSGPFEDQGLPAIAARIAASSGCENTDLAALRPGEKVPLDHCAALIADILLDEGVVPLDTDIACSETDYECNDLERAHTDLWVDQLDIIARGDPLIETLHDNNITDCIDESRDETPVLADRRSAICLADRTAALWADLAPRP